MQASINSFFRVSVAKGPTTKKRPRSSGRFQEVAREKSELGNGTYGQVFLAQDVDSGDRVAVKRCDYTASRKEGIDNFGIPNTALREINVLKECDHPHIVRLLDVHMSGPTCVDLVFELMQCDLKTLMRQRTLCEPDVVWLARQLLRGLAHLARAGVVHRDIKPQNLLLSGGSPTSPITHYTLKIADFGLARWLSAPTARYSTLMVTLWYRPPDMILGNEEYGTCCDMWSAGCVIAEMLRHSNVLLAGADEHDQLLRTFAVFGLPEVNAVNAYDFFATYAAIWTPPTSTMITRECVLARKVVCTPDMLRLLRCMMRIEPALRCRPDEALRFKVFADE